MCPILVRSTPLFTGLRLPRIFSTGLSLTYRLVITTVARPLGTTTFTALLATGLTDRWVFGPATAFPRFRRAALRRPFTMRGAGRTIV
jgi:hypothetical protein